MSITHTLSFGFLSLALLGFAGCVGPNAHGPLGGCCGPSVASNNNACTGCGELYVDPWINEPADCVDPCDTCGNYNGQSCGKCRPIFEGVKNLWGYRCGDDCGVCSDPGCAVSCGRGLLGGDGCGCGSKICGPSAGCDSCGGGCDSGCSSHVDAGVDSGEILYSHNDGQVIDGVVDGGEYIVEGGQPIIEGGQHIIQGGQHIVEGVPTPTTGSSGITRPALQKPFKPERTRKIFNPRPRVATGDNRSLGY